jgi:hypothetical protein
VVAAARAWQELFRYGQRIEVAPLRFALAAVGVLVEHDLALAVVSTCTILGRTPGAVERRDTATLVAVVCDHLLGEVAVAGRGDVDGGLADDAHGLALHLTGTAGWRQAEHLWAVRGRPSESEAERASLDWWATLLGRGLLGGPPQSR